MQKSFNFLKGLAVVSCIGLLLFSFWGCFEDPVSDEDSVTVQLGAIGSMGIDTLKAITGTITASPAIDQTALTITVTVASTGADAIAHFTKSGPAVITAKEEIDIAADLNLTFTPKSTVPTGTYRLTISAAAGTATGSDYEDFTVAGQTVTPITTKNFTLGAALSANGSSLDADIGSVYKTADLRGNSTLQATVDVYFAVTASAEPKLGAPSWANANGWGPETDGTWLSAPATEFIKVTADFSAIASQEAIDALWSGTPASNLVVAANDVVLVKTTANTYGAIQVVSAATTTSGDAVLNVKIKQ